MILSNLIKYKIIYSLKNQNDLQFKTKESQTLLNLSIKQNKHPHTNKCLPRHSNSMYCTPAVQRDGRHQHMGGHALSLSYHTVTRTHASIQDRLTGLDDQK